MSFVTLSSVIGSANFLVSINWNSPQRCHENLNESKAPLIIYTIEWRCLSPVFNCLNINCQHLAFPNTLDVQASLNAVYYFQFIKKDIIFCSDCRYLPAVTANNEFRSSQSKHLNIVNWMADFSTYRVQHLCLTERQPLQLNSIIIPFFASQKTKSSMSGESWAWLFTSIFALSLHDSDTVNVAVGHWVMIIALLQWYSPVENLQFIHSISRMKRGIQLLDVALTSTEKSMEIHNICISFRHYRN